MCFETGRGSVEKACWTRVRYSASDDSDLADSSSNVDDMCRHAKRGLSLRIVEKPTCGAEQGKKQKAGRNRSKLTYAMEGVQRCPSPNLSDDFSLLNNVASATWSTISARLVQQRASKDISLFVLMFHAPQKLARTHYQKATSLSMISTPASGRNPR